MALKLIYYGQNDSQWSPDQVLTGDPGTDQQTLTAAGYLGGKIMALGTPVNNTAVLAAISPADADTAGVVPFGALINGPGEFAGAIGPSGSKKAPIVRALWQGNVNSEAYDASATFNNRGLYTSSARAGSVYTSPVGICTFVPTAASPWLGVASLL